MTRMITAVPSGRRRDTPRKALKQIGPGILVKTVRLADDIRLVHGLDPVVRRDVLDTDRNGSLRNVRTDDDGLGDVFRDLRFLLLGSAG
jgi:hypothetical protein